MAKKNKKSRKISKSSHISTLPLVEESRTGGAIALTGFDYQCLYSCYTILSQLYSENASVHLEGIEDIDSYIFDNVREVTHYQIKYSTQKQDASYLKNILKNYLEVYLCETDNMQRNFVLIYDFTVADGFFKRLAEHNSITELSSRDVKYWATIVDKIKGETQKWDWNRFCFDDFFAKISFMHVEYNSLLHRISKLLINNYSISTGNELLYAHSLYFYCFSKMKTRGKINKQQLDTYILEISDDINKGATNPAGHWIKAIDFDQLPAANSEMYFEGKKATPSDIVAGLPIPRVSIENTIRQSIEENTITVIKASSGQGKTTLAWRVAYEERNNYSIYQINWCMDAKELDHIVEYIRSRIKVGEIPLIIFDNLDVRLKEWNQLACLLESCIGTNYRLLVTTREIDWYTYSGDQSNLRNLKVQNIVLDSIQAQEIFDTFKAEGKLHTNIMSWQSAWEQIGKKGLLIEFVYLLTHGEMLAERIASQMKDIEQQPECEIKFDLLRKICLADILGLNLSISNLHTYYAQERKDINSIIKAFENEYLMAIYEDTVYISGLHPVRSQHLLNIVHAFVPEVNTIMDLFDIVDDAFVSKLYSSLPTYTANENKEKLYSSLVEKTRNNSYTYFLDALKGVFSGSVYQYYFKHKEVFDDVNTHGGLPIFLLDINPYSKFKKFNTEIQTLESMSRTLPKDENITYLKKILDTIEPFELYNSDYYVYAHCLYQKALKDQPLKAITACYSELVYWMVNVDEEFCLISSSTMAFFWRNKDRYSPKFLSELMFSWYIAHEDRYMEYVRINLADILAYLQYTTQSMRLYEVANDNSIHVEYLLLPSAQTEGNKESVDRLNLICKFLPIYDLYCADTIQPQLDILSLINVPNDSHKRIPKEKLIIAYHSEFANLWTSTVLSMYEAPTVFHWLEHWKSMREDIVQIFQTNIKIFDRKLNQRNVSKGITTEFDSLSNQINFKYRIEYPYPRQNRPFEKNDIPEESRKIGGKYFPSIRNYINQAVGLLLRKERAPVLATFNLRKARIELAEMQHLYKVVANKAGYYKTSINELDKMEDLWINRLWAYSQFYINNPKTRIASQSYILSWASACETVLMEEIKQALEANPLGTRIFELPQKRWDDGALYTLPVITENIDFSETNMGTMLLMSLIPLVSFDVHFVTVIFKSDTPGMVNSTGMRINKDMLDASQKLLNNEDINADDIPAPLPIQITTEYLDLFEQKYQIKTEETHITGYDVLFELFWKYSQLNQYLTRSSEASLRRVMQQTIEKDIENIFESIQNKDTPVYNYALDLKQKVLNEYYKYGTQELNDSINFLMQHS